MAEDPEVVTTGVEELIRWVTPLNNFFRTAVRDDAIGGRPVAEGDRIILLYPSANRDEDVFDDPFRFDVTRSPNPHVAFGFGTHFCLGANLARFELSLLFAELTRRFEAPVVIERARRWSATCSPGRCGRSRPTWSPAPGLRIHRRSAGHRWPRV